MRSSSSNPEAVAPLLSSSRRRILVVGVVVRLDLSDARATVRGNRGEEVWGRGCGATGPF